MSGELNGTLTGPGTFDETGTTTIGSSLVLEDNVIIENEGILNTETGAVVVSEGDPQDEIINNNSGAIINLNSATIDASLINYGTINVVIGTSGPNYLTNNGTITFSAGNNITLSRVAFGVVDNSSSSGVIVLPFYDELVSGLDGTLTNTGVIEIEGEDLVGGGNNDSEALINDGVISVTGSGNNISGDITGTGSIQILAGGVLGVGFNTDIASSQNVALAGVGATLQVTSRPLKNSVLGSF